MVSTTVSVTPEAANALRTLRRQICAREDTDLNLSDVLLRAVNALARQLTGSSSTGPREVAR